MKVCFFEDALSANFWPLAETRPAYFLTCGIKTLAAKTAALFPGAEIGLFCRPPLSGVAAETAKTLWLAKKITVNAWPKSSALFINGRLLAGRLNKKLIKELAQPGPDRLWLSGRSVLAARLSAATIKELARNNKLFSSELFLSFRKIAQTKTAVKLLEHTWELILANPAELLADAQTFYSSKSSGAEVHSSARLLNKENIRLGRGCQISAGVVLDARRGPIVIDEGALIEHNAVVFGPAYLGRESSLKATTTVYGGTTIGPGCRIGGEINQSIIIGFSNKAHYGYLGHSYLGSWCNLGAGTTNSNLKNNYSPVKIWENGQLVQSGQQFLGLIMGDYTKAAIGTMFNTGTVVGIACNIFGTAAPPKYWPNFSWGDPGKSLRYKLADVFKTNQIMMARRHRILSAAQKKLLQHLYRQK